jgi:hypothetical protein
MPYIAFCTYVCAFILVYIFTCICLVCSINIQSDIKYLKVFALYMWTGIALSVQAGRSGDQNLVGARFSAPIQTSPGTHPVSCTMGAFPRGKVARGVVLTTHLMYCWGCRNSRAIHLLPLCGLMAGCYRVNITFLPENSPWYLPNRRLGRPHSWASHFAEEINLLLLLEFEPRSVQTVS